MNANREEAIEAQRFEEDTNMEDCRFLTWKILQIRQFLKAAELALPSYEPPIKEKPNEMPNN